MADRFSRLNNSSPVEQQLQADRVSVGRTAFDYSCIHNGNAIIGALTPVDCFDVVPNEDIDLSLASLLEFRNPSVRQLFNGMRVYFHAYYNRLTDLWEGAKNWIDNGRRGNVSLTRPRLIYKHNGDTGYNFNACTPMSLLNYLGLPVEVVSYYNDGTNQSVAVPLYQFKAAIQIKNQPSDVSQSKVQGVKVLGNATLDTLDSDEDFFPADCAFAYQRNFRDFYLNKNLVQNNVYWFPDNEDHFILSYSCSRACAINYEDESFGGTDSKCFDNIVGSFTNKSQGYTISSNPSESSFNYTLINCPSSIIFPSDKAWNLAPNLSALRFRQFKGDRFTTASPFPDLIRGDMPVINLNSKDVIPVTGYTSTDYDFYNSNGTEKVTGPDSDSVYHGAKTDNQGRVYYENLNTDSGAFTYFGVKIDSNISSITMSDIYTLETLTAFRRRLGLTNGDYNEMIKSQYGVSPNVKDRRGTYIGGFYQDFAFSSVTQQSQSTVDSPLGTKAGQGVSSGSGTIGHFHTPDFGWIQIYMSIVPDVYYTNSKPRQFSKKSNLEMYFPLFNNLPAQAIRNDELTPTNNPTYNESPFAYEDRFAEYKSRNNRVSGFMGLSPSVAAFDASRVMARRFDSNVSPTVHFGNSFVSMIPENIDYNVFSVVDEPPFDFSIGISCRRVTPMPYTAIEGSLSSPMLNNMGA